MDPIVLDTRLPAGNIHILSQTADGFTLTPDLRDTEGFWFYWKFRVRGAERQTLTFRFEGGPCLTTRGPAVSRDRGGSWRWLSDTPDAPEDHFEFTFGVDDHEVWFCMCLPYGPEDWERFRSGLDPAPPPAPLCISPGGHAVPLLELDGPVDRPRVLVTARHHCCETPVGFVLEGLVRRWMDLRPARLTAVPFMDLDGVIAGDQGKNRNGHDHNRDYGPNSRYPEVRALKRWVTALEEPFLAFDLHAPYIRYDNNESVFFVEPDSERDRKQLTILSERLEALDPALPYRASHNYPFGQGWNVPSPHPTGLSCGNWMRQQAGCRFAATLEVPYANASGVPVTADRARALGASLAEAISRTDPR